MAEQPQMVSHTAITPATDGGFTMGGRGGDRRMNDYRVTENELETLTHTEIHRTQAYTTMGAFGSFGAALAIEFFINDNPAALLPMVLCLLAAALAALFARDEGEVRSNTLARIKKETIRRTVIGEDEPSEGA